MSMRITFHMVDLPMHSKDADVIYLVWRISQLCGSRALVDVTIQVTHRICENIIVLGVGAMFPLIFFSVRGKVYSVSCLSAWIFFHKCHPRQQRIQSHQRRSIHPVSTLQTRVRVQRLDFHQVYITHMTLKITARQLEAAFFCQVHARPRSRAA